MSFLLNETNNYSLSQIKKQFSSFELGDKLPFCNINFLNRPRDIHQGKTLYKRVGEHSFYALQDGVMVANATTFAIIRENYSVMDVYLPESVSVPENQTAFLMLQAYRYSLANAGYFQMHSAVVVKDGFGVAFCGLPGAGKSTQAHLWIEHLDAKALNLDQPCVIFDDDDILVSGSPWSGKEDCYINESVSLKAILFVEQADENTVEKLSLAEAYSYLYLNNFLVPVNEDIEKKHKDAILKLVLGVPVYRLKCTISKEAVAVAYNKVFNRKEENHEI